MDHFPNILWRKSNNGNCFRHQRNYRFLAYGKAGAEKAASEHDDIEIEFKMVMEQLYKEKLHALLVRGFKGIAISPPNPTGQQQMINDWAKSPNHHG